MEKLSKHLTYANVVATLCLFLVLGGGAAFAASQLAKNSVGRKQLKKNAVNSAKVKDGTLRSADFMAGQLPVGPRGEIGPRGEAGRPGEPGLSGYVQANGRSASDSSAFKEAQAQCPPGTTIIGGGASITGGSPDVAFVSSTPAGADSWLAQAHETVATADVWAIHADAICARVTP